MVCDGKEGPVYRQVGPPVFSRNGEQLVYAALDKQVQYHLIREGQGPKPYRCVSRVSLSPSGKHIAFKDYHDKQYFIRLDGKKLPNSDGADSGCLFSPDGRELVYNIRTGDQYRVVRNGKESPPYDRLLFDRARHEISAVFSPDGRHLAYAARRGKQEFIVLDDAEQQMYDELYHPPMFSPDSKRLAYVARRKRPTDPPPRRSRYPREPRFPRRFVVDNGREGRVYEMVSRLTFSPDSKHLAYLAQYDTCLLYTSPSPRDATLSRMPSSA